MAAFVCESGSAAVANPILIHCEFSSIIVPLTISINYPFMIHDYPKFPKNINLISDNVFVIVFFLHQQKPIKPTKNLQEKSLALEFGTFLGYSAVKMWRMLGKGSKAPGVRVGWLRGVR